MSQENAILSKITAKGIGADAAKGKTGRVHLYRVYGKAGGIKVAEGKDGDAVYGLVGDFRAINPEEPNRVYQSGILYLPGGINEMVVQAVNTGNVDDKGRPVYNEVKFAFDIFSKPATNPAGYQFEAQAIVDAKETDVMIELQNELPPMPGAAAIADETEKKTKGK